MRRVSLVQPRLQKEEQVMALQEGMVFIFQEKEKVQEEVQKEQEDDKSKLLGYNF